MYLPSAFAAPGPQAIEELIDRHPFATLLSCADGLPQAEHLPLLRVTGEDGVCRLRGHLARANPMWRAIGQGSEALAVFHGVDHYVSPGWYPSKQQHGRVVPTWNYCVVHARGRLQAVHDADWLRTLLGELTQRHEAAMARPWRLEDAPADYLERMLAAIVGVELVVSTLEGKWKLSQNRSAEDRAGVVAGLDRLGSESSAAMARAIELCRQRE